ncbi:hypothetical protein RIF29_14898 [Crotalaria pallida]|uniref:Uncharacterized protein n=1 Tax=Crotalaria pallida TaxID=3830 RepID=A0AAN9ID51_CROPI
MNDKALGPSSGVKFIKRHVLWKDARVNKEGVIDDENVQRVVTDCETLSQTNTEGEIEERNPDDILAKALNKPERPGRVIGAGFGVSQTKYFTAKKQKTNEGKGDVELRKMVQDLVQKVRELESERRKSDFGCTGLVPKIAVHMHRTTYPR